MVDNPKTAPVPNKGKVVLVLDETGSGDAFETYRKRVLASGGRLRRATCERSRQRHLQVHTPLMQVHFKGLES